MHVENCYYYFEKVLSTEVCKKILQLGIDKLEKEKIGRAHV
jgi:hypothetical protein